MQCTIENDNAVMGLQVVKSCSLAVSRPLR